MRSIRSKCITFSLTFCTRSQSSRKWKVCSASSRGLRTCVRCASRDVQTGAIACTRRTLASTWSVEVLWQGAGQARRDPPWQRWSAHRQSSRPDTIAFEPVTRRRVKGQKARGPSRGCTWNFLAMAFLSFMTNRRHQPLCCHAGKHSALNIEVWTLTERSAALPAARPPFLHQRQGGVRVAEYFFEPRPLAHQSGRLRYGRLDKIAGLLVSTTHDNFSYHDHRHQATTHQTPPHTMSTGTRLPDLILPIQIIQLILHGMQCRLHTL